jgi:hypothetical protein
VLHENSFFVKNTNNHILFKPEYPQGFEVELQFYTFSKCTFDEKI